MFRNNKIILIKQNGKQKQLYWVKGLQVQFKGTNNCLIFYNKVPKFKNSFIDFGNKNRIIIKSSIYKFSDFSVNCRGENNLLEIGEDFSCTGKTHLSFGKENNLKISIGQDCMFATNVFVRASDIHSIIDLEKGEYINNGQNISIGNHCWLAMNTTILKGSIIPNNCIIGTGSIVTKPLEQENSIYAGIPAKLIKSQILWDRKCPTIRKENND